MNTIELRPIQVRDREEVRKDEYVSVLQHSEATLGLERNIVSLPLEVSYTRGQLPVLTHQKGNIDMRSIAVVANCGALSFNSRAFPRADYDLELAKVIAHDKGAYAARMLTYTKDGDIFVYESPDSERSIQVLNHIRNSYQQIGINVTRNFKHVSSVDEWIKEQKGQMPLLANAYDPLLLASFGRTFAEKERLFQSGLVHAAAYTKNAMTEIWRDEGVPVPPTYYYEVNGNKAEVSTDIISLLSSQGYSHAVVSTYDGAGGDGVRFIPLENMVDGLSGRFANGNVMVQGKLPLEASPCVIANISEDEITPLLISKQRFSSPGAHGGNIWEKGDQLLQTFPLDFMPVVMDSLAVLQKKGIRGQVNVDPLVITPEVAAYFGLSHTTLMREANIRMAGSSVNLRIKEGNIGGVAIGRVHTTSFEIPYGILQSPDFLYGLNSQRIEGTQVLIYGYDIYSDKASVAFVGTKEITEEALTQVEQDTRALFK